jgi:serine/threonine protein kinase
MKLKYNTEVDVWAVGVLLFFMLFGNIPFKSMNMLHEITKKCENGFSLAKMKKKINPSINEEQMKKIE